MLTGSGDNTARLWDATTGREIRRFEGHKSDVYSVAFGPDGATVLTGSRDGTARLWDAATGREIRRFDGHQSFVYSVAFGPDGATVLTGSGDASLWDAATGREIRRFEGHEKFITSVAFSPDGAMVLTASWDETGRLWDAATGREIRRLKGHEGTVTSVAFGPDGRQVLTGGDKTARLWAVPEGPWPEEESAPPQVAGTTAGPAPDAATPPRATPEPSPPRPAPEPRPDAMAIVIGNRQYGHGAPEVPYAHNDAAAFAAYFTDVLGLEQRKVIVKKDITSVGMARLFGTAEAPEGLVHRVAALGIEEVFVVYSGHGVPRLSRSGPARGYLLPVDVPPGEPEFGAYGLARLIEQLEALPVARVTLFLDACFSGLSQGGALVPETSGSFGVAVAAPEQRASVSVLAATAFDRPQFAHWLDDREHGAFTWYALAGLRGAADAEGDGAVSLDELHAYVRREVGFDVLARTGREQTPSLRQSQGEAGLLRLPH